MILTLAPLTCMLLLPPADEFPNPWRERAKPAVGAALESDTPAALRAGLDAAYRADDWAAGLKIAARAEQLHGQDSKLRPLIARAHWRAGRLDEAERRAADLPADTQDPVALNTLVTIELARGNVTRAAAHAQRLEALPDISAADLYQPVAVRFQQNRFEDFVPLLKTIEQRLSPENGYPETFLGESLDGLPAFFAAVGERPVNVVAHPGAAPIEPIPLINLIGCSALINGKGPYRLLVDTGGSLLLSLDRTVAEEIGLKSIVSGSIRGVSGKDHAGQALVDDLALGSIRMSRVLTRIFDVKAAAADTCDGILGTGVFAHARMTLDFATGRLVISPSSPDAPAGTESALRIVGDAKLVSPVKVNGGPGLALIDSGADSAVLSPSKLRELYPDRPVTTVAVPMIGVGSGKDPKISLEQGVAIEFAGRHYPAVAGIGLDVLDTVLSPVLGVQLDVLLGMSMLRDARSLTIDYPRCRMWIDWIPTAVPRSAEPSGR
jgi:hypothetical protein